ncbi:MAG: hypothetical protein RBR35_12685 [Salinivirgaceae bacterium]|nr:hypothetical protein [Salinivirgaceae bacterium]
MKTNFIIAIVLIAIGIAAFGYQGITYTTREKVVDVGALTITSDKTRTIPLPPVVGALALAGGIGLLVLGRKKIDHSYGLGRTGKKLSQLVNNVPLSIVPVMHLSTQYYVEEQSSIVSEELIGQGNDPDFTMFFTTRKRSTS